MKRTVLWTVLLSGFAGAMAQAAPSVLAPSIWAQTAPSMRAATATEEQAFRKLYARADMYMARRNLGFLRNITTDDYVLRLRSGAMLNKPQYLNLTNLVLRRTLKINALRTRIDRIGTEKNRAVVVSTSTTDMTYRGLDNRAHRSVSTSQMMDSWILLRQGWRLQSSQEIATRSTVDGRAYPPTVQATSPQPMPQPKVQPTPPATTPPVTTPSATTPSATTPKP